MKKTFIFILFLLCLTPSVSFAADIFFSAEKKVFVQNEYFLVQVLLDTKDKKVNAVEGVVSIPADLLELKEIRDGNSAINFWVEKPHSSSEGKVSFSGITTGGFSGPRIFLFSLVFSGRKSGSGIMNVGSTQVLENDGLGTQISTKIIPFNVSISNEVGAGGNLVVEDTTPPESFNPFIASDPSLFDGKYFLVFSTVDKGSGIDHYEVRESPWFFFGIPAGQYIQAESPYLLKDQTLKSKIYIKAVDKAHNERVVELRAQNKWALFLQSFIFGIILVICILLFTMRRKRRLGFMGFTQK